MRGAWDVRDGTRGDLFDLHGRRRYLTRTEAKSVLKAALQRSQRVRLFCYLLYYTGARVSEALQICPSRLDAETGRVIFRTLKRRATVYRAVPVPFPFLRELLDLAAAHKLGPDQLLFPWCRQTAYRHIRSLMVDARIEGPQAVPRGFRHAYGCMGIQSGLPESLVGKLLGHADLRSTRVYTRVMGDEERALTARMWR